MTKSTENLPGDLLQRARDMKPRLRELAEQAENERCIPTETIDAFRDAGFFRILQPRSYGGYELSPQNLADVVFEVASACGSSGWTLAVLGLHQWEVQLLSEQAMEEIWSENREVLLSSAYAPTGQVVPVDGGFRLTGRWPYSSGCDHAEWAILGGFTSHADEGQGPMHCGFFVPASDYRIIDDWQTMGLAGTGSKTIELDDVFVPSHRHHPIFGFAPAPPEGASPIYRIPFGLVFVDALCATVLGIAQGVHDLSLERCLTRQQGMDPAKYQDNPDVHRYLAETEYAIRSATSMRVQNQSEAMRIVGEGGELSMLQKARYLWEAAKSSHVCAEAVARLYAVSGAHTIYQGDPLQRAWRDCQAGVTHMAFNFNLHGRNYGAMRLGKPNTLTFI